LPLLKVTKELKVLSPWVRTAFIIIIRKGEDSQLSPLILEDLPTWALAIATKHSGYEASITGGLGDPANTQNLEK
jgi:hypothetical protein